MKKLILSSLLLLIMIIPQANAYVVTFDDSYANSILEKNNINPISDMGLTFTNNGSVNGSVMDIWDSFSPNSNGTNNLDFAGYNPSYYIAITKTGGGTFDLTSLDMSISWYDSKASEIIYINGSPITLGQGIQTYMLNMSDINEVDITAIGGTGYWLLDNVVYSVPVPEPATMLLFSLGLIGLAGIRRKIKIQNRFVRLHKP